MFLTRFWNRWISVLIRNCCSRSRVLSAHGQLWQTSPPKNTLTHLGAEVMLSFPVYLQFIEPLDPRCEVKLVDIARERRLPVLENRRVPSKDQEKEGGFCNSQKPSEPEAWRDPHGLQSLLSPTSTWNLVRWGLGSRTPTRQGARAVLIPKSPHWEQVQRVGTVRYVEWVSLSTPWNTSLCLKNR